MLQRPIVYDSQTVPIPRVKARSRGAERAPFEAAGLAWNPKKRAPPPILGGGGKGMPNMRGGGGGEVNVWGW